MKLFALFLAATLSIGVVEAKTAKKSSRKPASDATEVLPANTPYDVNPEGDRSMTCSVDELNMRWEGSVRISDFHVQADSDSFKITYRTSRDGQAKVAHGICAGANGTYSCELDGQTDSSGVSFSGSIAKVGNDVSSNIQMQFAGDADTGPRAAETYPVHCSVPCVIDNFIRTGHLNGNGTQNSCASTHN